MQAATPFDILFDILARLFQTGLERVAINAVTRCNRQPANCTTAADVFVAIGFRQARAQQKLGSSFL